MRQPWFKFLLLGFGLIDLVLFVLVGFRPDGLEHIYFLNVSQGDATLIQTPDSHYILIDGGPDSQVISQLGQVLPPWHRQLDLVILTHPHADHATGLLSVLGQYHVQKFWYAGTNYDSETYRTLMGELQQSQIPVEVVGQGATWAIGQNDIQVISPTANYVQAEDPNESSIVNLIRYRHFAILLTGDASSNNEKLYAPALSDVDVIKVPHHGSDDASSPALLKASKPEVGVIEVGQDNSYGHPSDETLTRYEEPGTKIYRTDINGRVEIITDGSRYLVKPQH